MGGRWVKFFYDGAGILIRKQSSIGEIWDYTGLVYKNNIPYQMPQPEGRLSYRVGLLEMIKENSSLFANPQNVIDLVLNIAPHQSGNIPNHDTIFNNFSMHDDGDILSGNKMKSVRAAFSFDNADGVGASHKNGSFVNPLNAFFRAFNNGLNDNIINDFVNNMKKNYGITVTVK